MINRVLVLVGTLTMHYVHKCKMMLMLFMHKQTMHSQILTPSINHYYETTSKTNLKHISIILEGKLCYEYITKTFSVNG